MNRDNADTRLYAYLCRHGQTHWNQHKILQGQLNSPLTELGEQQAESLGQRAQQWNIGKVASSSLGRAVQTATICARQLKVTQSEYPLLAERHFGDWQGQPATGLTEYQQFREIRYEQPDTRPPGRGESTNMVIERLTAGLTALAEQESARRILIISHGDALACLAGTFGQRKALKNGEGLLLCYAQNRWSWQGWLDE